MHTLKLIYTDFRTQHFKESITYAASIDLFVHNKINSSQSSVTELVSDNSRDCLFASLALADSAYFTVEILDKRLTK